MSVETTQSGPGPKLPGAAGSDEVWDDWDDEGCYLCGGTGAIVTCIDDLCRGSGECMHGDGEQPCPACCGERKNAEALPPGGAKGGNDGN